MALAFITLFALTGFAFAQEVNFNDFRLWFENPVFFIAAIVAITNWLRERYEFIDGRVRVGAASVAVGMVAGLIADFSNLITVVPFAEMNFPLGGLLYGATGGMSAVIGVSLFDFFITRASSRYAEAKANHQIPEGGTK